MRNIFQHFENPILLSRYFLERTINSGDWVIDATCGNGHDTLYLHSLVGDSGRVYAFDNQLAAVASTKSRLPLTDSIRVFHRTHQDFDLVKKDLETNGNKFISAINYNLGYFPGGDHSIYTQFETTIASIKSGLDLLKTGGLIVILSYWGHDEGKELSELKKFIASLSPGKYAAVESSFLNRNNSAVILMIEKKADS